MPPIGWIRETLAEHQERQEEKRQAREQERQRKQAIKQRQREAEQRALRLELQRRDNIINILDDNKLPNVDWSHYQPLPFKFLKSEYLLYVFPSVGYAEQRIKREIIGRSAGTSVRVARGVSAPGRPIPRHPRRTRRSSRPWRRHHGHHHQARLLQRRTHLSHPL